ncbi:MAG TPA: ester cyclase [Gaiellaceae bacterium]
MSQSPENVVRRLIEEGFNEGRLEVADELTSPDLVEHQSFGPDHAPGAEGVKAVIASLRRAFSDFHLEIEDLSVDGDKVWLRMVGTGTNDGPFMGHEPTGRPMRTDVFDLIRVTDGKMVEHWGVPDRLGTLFQLGLARPPAAAAAAAAA